MDDESKKKFARAILDAQRIHEKSYVKGPDSTYMLAGVEMTYPTGEYTKDHMVSANEALGIQGDPEETAVDGMGYVIYLLNSTAWNDIQLWSEAVLGIGGVPLGEAPADEHEFPVED